MKSIAVALVVLLAAFVASPAEAICTQQDIAVLNYALTLEHLESAFYQTVLAKFSTPESFNFSYITDKFANYTYVYDNFVRFANDEAQHVSKITSTIESLCPTLPKAQATTCRPVPACSYNFSLNTTESFAALLPEVIDTVQALETVGVGAYDGAINSVTNPALLTAAASIATVEARHLTFLRVLTGQVNVAPNTFDTALPKNQVLCSALPFISNPSSCRGFTNLQCSA